MYKHASIKVVNWRPRYQLSGPFLLKIIILRPPRVCTSRMTTGVLIAIRHHYLQKILTVYIKTLFTSAIPFLLTA